MVVDQDDFEIANMGSSWLQGLDMDEHLGKELKFQRKNQSPRDIVRSLSWLMSLTGPAVLAFDQLDPIVHQVARQTTIENVEEQNTARWIIDQIGCDHARLGVTPAHFAAFGEALVWAWEQHLGSAFTAEVRWAWTTLYEAVRSDMLRAMEADHGQAP